MTLNSIAKRTFALYRKKLNPHKHMFMTKNVENMYESYAWPGRIFEIKRLPERQASIQTTEGIVKATFDFFKRVAPQNFTFGVEDYDKIRQNSWWVYEVNFDQYIDELTAELKQHCLATIPNTNPKIVSDFFDKLRNELKIEPTLRNYKIEIAINIYAKLYTHFIDNPEFFKLQEPEVSGLRESEIEALLKSDAESAKLTESTEEVKKLESGRFNLQEINPVCRLLAWLHS